jgi:hypothetical protein
MKQPILIGVEQLRNRSVEERDAREPADLMVEAVELALEDTGIAGAVRAAVDSIDGSMLLVSLMATFQFV